MKITTKKILLVPVLLTALLCGCSYSNKEDVKENAQRVFAESGYKITGYQGYQWGKLGVNGYGGAYVWFNLKKDSNGINYQAAMQKWGDEYHIYNLEAIDAIAP